MHRSLIRPLLRSRIIPKREILTPAFALNQEWNERHTDISRLGLGGDYEWIATVQKKFIGGGFATAVDVDVAVCMGEEKDQVEDLLDILRKLRHSPLAARVAPSSQYAILRLLLKHNPKEIIQIAKDPINNGIFADEHSACLILNSLIEKKEWKDGARISGWMTHQEEYNSELVKALCLYSCLRWVELPFEQRVEEKEEEEEINDDDIVTVKMAFLKNKYNDNHFDLVDLPSLTAKTIVWLSREMNIDAPLKSSIESVSTVIEGSGLPSIDTLTPYARHLILSYLSTLPDQAEETKQYIEKMKIASANDTNVESLSGIVLTYLKNIQEKEENILMEKQKKKFDEWNERRRNLIEVQTKRLQLKVMRSEMERELHQLEEEEQRLFFFGNRLLLEKAARENAEIANETSVFKMQSVRSKELDSRCRLLAERLTECALIVDHDPSLALYRLNEHISRSVPVIVNSKLKLSVSSIKMNHVQRDLENAIKVTQGIDNSSESIDRSSRLLEQCIHFKDQISATQLKPTRSLRIKK